ncbi:beta-galactosidase trimerization domain-containing protein [Phycisphaerales bacterium AB-hyl4]|uniref:Beta-galactosidase trimerization domain-containing protein n=1 Tax=Natronomicrosphaera hydrolytica TaxID=3242702 RepID=A0ABV4U3L7_9BACT
MPLVPVAALRHGGAFISIADFDAIADRSGPRSFGDHIAGVLKQHGHKLAGTHRPKAKVALMYSRPSDLVGRIEMLALKERHLPLARSSDAYPYKRALRMSHFLYQALGHTTDFVTPDDDLKEQAVVHIPAMEIVDKATADRLSQYVQAGGRLIVEYPFACRDEKTWVAPDRPMHDLAKLLGCREAERIALNDRPLSVRFAGGKTVDAAVWRVNLTVTDGEPIAWWPNDAVAAVRHRVGLGEVHTLGLNLSLSAKGQWEDPAMDVLDDLLRGAGVEPEHQADRGVLVRRRVSGERSIWFVFNVAPERRLCTLPAEPTAVWHEMGIERTASQLTLSPGAVFVAELPDIPGSQ